MNFKRSPAVVKTRRVGELPQDVRDRIDSLCLEQLENLGEALRFYQLG